ncbi:hypothetical protein [Pseudomonas syringae pv. coryli]|uniref:hypothetical protein n=1 Tax=Pseudomonas syringae pv. coryli TaxID=317659 RepID=UPI000619C45A|nr:hypothetical protein [Pseudomonas syringae pv. coryli]
MSKFRNLNIDVVVNGETINIDGKKRTEFVQLYGLDELIPNRYSEIFVVDLIMNLELSGVDPTHIIDEVKRLETLSNDGYTKEATQFKHAPLHPLWHQHYFSDHFLVHNIQNEIKKSFNTIWDESMGEKNSVIERKHLDKLVHNLVEGTIETRSNEKRITGEWLVFSKEITGNIYLCMATHTTGDTNIYNTLEYCCEHQFPLLEPFTSNRRAS